MFKELLYRAVEKADFKEICKFPQNPEELFFMFPKAEFPFTINQLENAVQTRFDSTVVLCSEEIIGFANFYEVNEDDYCSIGNVIVKPNFRNKGIGKFLIKTMESIAVEKYNVSELHLSCFNTNTSGILLYSKLGYKPYGIDRWTNCENKTFALIKMKRENIID
jgi:ribosomal protein S18 acetylase RimI-like enzyme